jgi:Short C-terminal domain/Phospholipase_D-nuclease N-terminal
MLASFEFGDAFLSLLWLFYLVVFFWLLITVFSDLFRDHEMSGWAKAAWILFVVIFQFIGVLIYLIARGGGMQKRALAQQKQAESSFKEYVQQQAAVGTAPQQLETLSKLHDSGKLTDEEFAAQKAKILAS